MSNPIFNLKGNQNNALQMMSQFSQFKQMIKGKDVRKMYDEAINSGKYTKEQIEDAKQKANFFQGLLR